MWHEPEIWWRVVNGVLSMLAFVLLLARVFRIWKDSSTSMRLLGQALLLYLFATMVASIENIFQDNPLGLRTAITTVCCAWVLLALRTPASITPTMQRKT